jgi:hypothetical protein
MSGFARIDSVDQLRVFRTVLVKFAEHVMTALADAEGEMQRTLVWLETEANTYWSGQIRKRHEAVEKAKDAVRQKKLFKSPTGAEQSAVEEEKQLRVAQKRLEEAEEKLKNVKRYTPRLQKEVSIYKGGVQRLSTSVASDIPTAVGRLDRMVAALEAYAAMQMSGGGGDDSGAELFQRMARALGDMGPGGGGGGAGAPDVKPLRGKTAAVERKATKAGDVRLEKWMSGPLHEKERELFSKITSDRAPMDPNLTILVEEGAWESSNIYLERAILPPIDDPVNPSSPNDSGWYLGVADAGEPTGPSLSMKLGDLLQARPDFAESLTLPRGHLVLMDMTSVKAIFDERGKEIWGPIKPPASTPAPAGA